MIIKPRTNLHIQYTESITIDHPLIQTAIAQVKSRRLGESSVLFLTNFPVEMFENLSSLFDDNQGVFIFNKPPVEIEYSPEYDEFGTTFWKRFETYDMGEKDFVIEVKGLVNLFVLIQLIEAFGSHPRKHILLS